MEVSVDEGYSEACKALGEAIVIQRLLSQEVLRLTAVIEAQAKPAEQV